MGARAKDDGMIHVRKGFPSSFIDDDGPLTQSIAGCGIPRPVWMISADPDTVTCLECRQYASDLHTDYANFYRYVLSVFRLVEGADIRDLIKISDLATNHRSLASQFGITIQEEVVVS